MKRKILITMVLIAIIGVLFLIAQKSDATYWHWGDPTPFTTWHAGPDVVIKGDKMGWKATGDDAWAVSPVLDTGRDWNYIGYFGFGGNISLTKKIRGSTESFLWDAGAPAWETYAPGVNKNWRYIQLRFEKAGGAAPVVQSTTVTAGTDYDTSHIMNMPVTRPAGDLYIAVVAKDGSDAITEPVGGNWTELFDVAGDTGVRHAVYWKIGEDKGGGNEQATYEWTDENECWVGAIIRITGFDSGDPIDISDSNSGANGAILSPAVVVSVDNTLVIRTYGRDSSNEGVSYPADHTGLFNVPSTAGGGNCGGGAATMDTPPGATESTGTADWYPSGNGEQWGAGTIVVNPA